MIVLPNGNSGLVEIKNQDNKSVHIFSDLPLGLGPFISKNTNERLELDYLKPNQNSQTFLHQSQRFIDLEMNFNSFKQNTGSSNVKSDFSFARNYASGKIELDEFEMKYFEKKDLNCENSTSFQREPLHQNNFVRGKSTNLPFQPGGLEQYKDDFSHDKQEILEFDSDSFYIVPPGLERGVNFNSTQQTQQLNIHDIFSAASYPFSVHQNENDINQKESKDEDPKSNSILKDVDSFLPDDNVIPSLLPERLLIEKKAKEWVHMIDVNLAFSEFEELVPEMAHEFNFELDTFQKRAIYHLENSESVFVAAHTSAGKTVVAEYAIALAMKHMTRAIYTSPIKALSNQKYRDFKRKFDDVGILTGDIQINSEASCLIMTTEILRSMLYRGADIIRDVEFVIFDEVHYLNDSERGVVWEEVIIMLPEHVTLILLSATVPNTKEFAGWIGRTKKKDIYVISTLKRPVPLEHFLFADRETFQIVDSNKNFSTTSYKKVHEIFHPLSRKETQTKSSKVKNNYQSKTPKTSFKFSSSGQSSTDRNMYVNLVSFLKKKDLLPAIVFAFSKKKCEEYAQALSNLDLTSGAAEKAKIHIFVQQSLACLNGSDKELPQILRLTELLLRGIAVHHSGLLPILKEIVEILFTRGLVKVLFSTETFAMGVNAPAKTVVFAMIRKHDGANFRQLLPGEYTQMAGRAGRRGLDTTGVVIITCSNDIPDELELRTMILGKATKLESQFRVTYNMILNLLRVEAIKVEEMIKRSFSENATQKGLPEQEKMRIENVKKLSKIEKLECGICVDIRGFYEASSRALQLGYAMQDKIINHPIAAKALSCGRIVLINTPSYRNTLAVILKPAKSTKSLSIAQTASRNITSSSLENHSIKLNDSDRHFWVALAALPNSGKRETDDIAFPVDYIHLGPNVSVSVENIPFSAISIVTIKQIKIQNVDEILSKNDPEMQMLLMRLLSIGSEIRNDGILEYDWSKIRDLEFQEHHRERLSLLKVELKSFQCTKCPELLDHYGIVHQERKLQETVRELEHNMSDLNLELLPDYHQRISVLKELQFIDESSIVQIKGRVACEINTADELILTELILENFLIDFDPSEIVALLSCFVFQEKSLAEPILTPNLERGIERIKQTALKVAHIQRSNGLDILPEEAIGNLKFGLVEVVYEWARGLPFKHITDLTDVLEGSIVRCIVRLSETCREVSSAARLIGDGNLFKKSEEAALLIKRDIVFAASLYF